MPWCLEEIDRIYRRLDVHFDHTHGESFYKPMLPSVVQELARARGIAQESKGAVVIFFGEDEPPAMVRKSDGAFTYTTTDLATIRYRMDTWHPDAILYVVDSRQALHFQEPVRGGTALGLRQGRAGARLVRLGARRGPADRSRRAKAASSSWAALLDEAVQRAGQVYEQTRQEERSAARRSRS